MAVTSCDDFLGVDSRSQIRPDDYYSTAGQAQAAVNGLYNNLRIVQNDTGYGERIWVTLELMALHATTLGQSFNNNQFINQSIDPANPSFSSVWNTAYNGIGAANLAITRIPAIDMDETQKTQLLGQAYFIRAYLYNLLVRLYGDVPLLTEPVNGPGPNLYPSRSPKADVYNLIISDLQTAEAAGLPVVDRTGRISQSAVKALLADVYLTTAGFPMQIKENYQKAADKAAEVIDAGSYPLFANYISLHNNTDKNQGEFILQAQYANGIATNAISPLIVPYNVGISAYGDEYGSLIPTEEFYNSYEAGDLRAQEQQFYFSEYRAFDRSTNQQKTNIVKFNRHALYKYFHLESALNRNYNCDENWTLIRMPEVMLIYAEAINEASAATPKAYEQINKIRARAKLPALSGLSQDAFRQAVWKERYHELAYENKAYFDIQRTRKAYDVKNNTFVNVIGFKGEVGPAFQEKYLLWGIPSTEINNNKELTQNPGW
ncbi:MULTISPECIES: RagB/SusD family nutrient uptake outer membrane protein [Hymenobacter]|uniref:RagB/SusD family nutrient uptake outer membrane protein n=2 Tax=Hymenobacter TaxID=89966 RepID=A0ABS6X4P3_9BACT|nr:MULTISPECIES: RagB/SusD family nutrient uptake outer membrane protein [Hymenobacter]MBO3269526.1 RagB/SusD family nutrient uptake outer membrane protein [Hymenobacter defluvii]MBW3130805.1 RagB/SusD family nutrient uptake outer membrane protein [Hymenobacter profundi]